MDTENRDGLRRYEELYKGVIHNHDGLYRYEELNHNIDGIRRFEELWQVINNSSTITFTQREIRRIDPPENSAGKRSITTTDFIIPDLNHDIIVFLDDINWLVTGNHVLIGTQPFKVIRTIGPGQAVFRYKGDPNLTCNITPAGSDVVTMILEN